MALPPDELPLFSALLSTLCALSLERSLAWTRLPLLGLLSEQKSLKMNQELGKKKRDQKKEECLQEVDKKKQDQKKKMEECGIHEEKERMKQVLNSGHRPNSSRHNTSLLLVRKSRYRQSFFGICHGSLKTFED